MTTFLLYSSIFIILAFFESRHLHNHEDYFVASRKAGSIQTGFSVIASCVGASATIGMCGLAFSIGLPAIWWLLSGVLGLIILRIFLLKRLRNQRCLTMLEIVKQRLGNQATKICALIIVAAWTSILAAQFSAMGSIVSQMLAISAIDALLLGSCVIVCYTILGGQSAVMKSDVIQLTVIVLGLLILLSVTVWKNPSGLQSMKFELFNNRFQFEDWTRFALLIGGSYIVCPMLFSRFLSSRSDAAAKKGAIIAIVGLTILAFIIVLIGIEARYFVNSSVIPDQVLSAVVDRLPYGMGIVLTLVLISAILSSADSCLITAATVVSNDIFQRPSIRFSRFIMLILSVAAFYLASSGKAILELMLMANNMYVCSVVAPVFAALCSQKMLHRPIVITTIISCAILALMGEWHNDFNLSLLAFALSILGSVTSWFFGEKNSDFSFGSSKLLRWRCFFNLSNKKRSIRLQ